MLNIGFIFPSSDYLFDPFRGDPHTHFQILTVLEEEFGNRVNLSLIDLRGIKREFAVYHIPDCDVYLYSTYTLDYEELMELVRCLRERFPRARHISGGPHATIFQEESLETFDSLIIGEGENAIVAAIRDVMDGRELKRIYREESPVDINRFPFPRRKYLPAASVARPGLMTMKIKPGYDKLLSTTVMFSRGCPYACSFCAIGATKRYSPGIRFRRPDLIREEIEYLKREYGMQGISLLDEIAIPLKKERAIAHLEAIGETGIFWRGQTRVDALTPEIARRAKESGCLTMSLGVETISQRSLDIVNKKVKVEMAKNTIHLLRENGIECRVYLVSGIPGEPEDVVERTLDFLEETQPDLVTLSMFTVRPGTEVYENPKKFGIKRIFYTDWRNMMNLQNRYEKEPPKLTFEYDEVTPWGKGFSQERIISNFLELQDQINKRGFSAALFARNTTFPGAPPPSGLPAAVATSKGMIEETGFKPRLP